MREETAMRIADALERSSIALERIALILSQFLPEEEVKDGPPEFVMTQDGMVKVGIGVAR